MKNKQVWYYDQFWPPQGHLLFATGYADLYFLFELFSNFHQIDSKNKAIGNSAHARCQKGGVPEEAEIGRTPIPF